MRFTIDIPDAIHARLKALAKEEDTTMRAIVLQGTEEVLRERRRLIKAEATEYVGKRS